MKNERTLVLIKPDGVKRGLIGEIIKRFEARGLKIVALQIENPKRERMSEHYPKEKEWITNLGKNTEKSYKEFNIPSLMIQEDMVDARGYNASKIRKEIEEFIKILG